MVDCRLPAVFEHAVKQLRTVQFSTCSRTVEQLVLNMQLKALAISFEHNTVEQLNLAKLLAGKVAGVTDCRLLHACTQCEAFELYY